MISDSVVRACTNLLAYLAEPAARAIALGGLAAIVLGALRVKRVPLRLFAWTTVLYGAVAIALVGWLLPGLPMRVPGAATIERIVAANQRVANAVRMMDEFVFARRMKETQEAKETHAETGAAKAGGFSEAAANQALLTKSNVQLSERQSGVEFRQSSANPAGIREADRRTPKKATADSSASATEGVLASASLGASGVTAEDAIARPPAAQARAGQALPLRTTHAERTALTVVDGSTQGGKAAATNASSTAGTGIPWVVVAAGIYAAIALLLLGRLLLGLVLSHRLARLSEKISDGDAVRKLRFRAYASGLESVPQMAESELVSVPATLNVFRPVILLPAHWREWDEAKLDAILAHEVSHVARRDSLTQRISLIHRAIFWFSPLAWWLDRRLNELAEEASDEAALGAGADKNRYAEMLLGFFADLEAASGRVWWQGVSMASDGSRAGHAEKRVERILSWGGSISMKKSLAVALVAVAAPVIFLAAAVHPVIARAQDKTQDDSKNVIMPGGPKAPALPNAPKGGVAGGVVATAPSAGVPGGVNASAPAAATFAGTPAGVVAPEALAASTPPTAGPNSGQPVLAPPTGGVVGPMRTIASVPSAQPALMPVPGAGENPPIVPGPIANGPVTPAARADYASNAPVTAVAPMATQEGVSSDMQDAERQVRDAQKEVKRAESAMPKDEDAIAVAQKALSDAEAQLAQARAAEQSVREAKAAMETAQAAMKEAQEKDASITYGNFNTSYGPRYVMMSRNSNEVNMSGDEEDLQHARELKKKLNSDFIWFEKDEKSYVITDPDFISKAKALFAPEEALSKQQDELGRQQDELGRQQDALGEKMDGVKVKIRDITPELEEIRARLKELNAQGGATQEELGRLQSRLGELQSEVGHSQSEAGAGQSEIGRQQGDLGRKQGELGRRQGELGRQQGEIAKKASRELRQMFEDAIAKGIAKPE